MDTMQQTGADFTNTFRGLSGLRMPADVLQSLANVKSYAMQQCATLEDLQDAHAPNMDPR